MYGFILTINDSFLIQNKYRKLSKVCDDIKIIKGNDSMLNYKDFYHSGAKLLYGRELRKGEVFCTLGHCYIYKEAMNYDDWTLVLEDDAVIDDSLFKFIDLCKKWDPESPVILLLGHSKTLKSNLWFQNFKQPMYNVIKIGDFVIGEKNVDLVGTVGYLINNSAAKIISENNLIFWKADHFSLYKNMGIKIMHMKNPVIWEDFKNKLSGTNNCNSVHHNIFSKFFIKELLSAFLSRIRILFK